MTLSDFKEKINTECDVLGNIELDVEALKVDAPSSTSLKSIVGCAALKSCDYFKKYDDDLVYFIEISDFHYELQDYIDSGLTQDIAEKKVKEGMRLKLSDSFLIYNKMINYFSVDDIEIKKVLLVFCKTKMSDVVAFSFLSNNLQLHYKPTFCSSIKVIPYTELKNKFNT